MNTAETTSGFLNINKPAGITSHDVVDQIRRVTGLRRVGHTGTLDPFATGILLVVVGSATRLMEYTHALPKTYEAVLTLGATSDTDDVTGKIFNSQFSISNQFSMPQIQKTLQQFTGTIEQIPPAYAAVKIKGKKLYEYARAGESIERKPRTVVIENIELRQYQYPQLSLRVVCGSGTYIRALGRDIGEALGTGAYVSTLRRTAIGSFELSTAQKLETLTPETWQNSLLPPSRLVAHLPSVTLDDQNVAQLKQGKAIGWEPDLPSHSPLALFDADQTLVGIGSYDPLQHTLSPHKIL